MKTFTTYAEKKAKQFLNLLQGYTKGIRITAILILLLMGVSNAWAYEIGGNGVVFYYANTGSWTGINMYYWGSGWSNNQAFTKINNTNIYYYKFSSTWTNLSGIKFNQAKDDWSKQSSNDITGDLKSSRYWKGTETSSSTTLAQLNGAAKVITKISTGGNYTEQANAACVVTISGYNLAANAISATAVRAETGSASSASINAAYGSTINYASNTPTGYDFKGFSTSNSTSLPNSTSTTKSVTASKVGGTANTTYYAYYLATQYTITYELNGGSGTMTPTTYNIETATFSLLEPTRNGYKFDGWYENSSFTGTAVTQIVKGTTGNKTFYAKWIQNATYSLLVEAGAGIKDVTGSKDPVTLGSSYSITATPKTGYTFSTWTANPAANATFANAASANTTVTVKNGSVTVTASATEIMSTLTTSNKYDAGNPSYAVPSATVSKIGYETTATVTAPAAGNGYTFTGWTLTNCTRTDNGATNATSITVRSNGDSKNAEVIANYKEDLATTKWYISGNGNGSGNDLTPGSPFTGWATNGIQMFKKSGHSTEEIYYCTITANTVASDDAHFPFKVYNATTAKYWGNSGYWVTKENNSPTLSSNSGDNMKFRPYLTGTYEFKLDATNASSPVLTVTWPVYNQLRISAANPADATNTGEFDMTGSGTYTVTRSLNANTTYTFKIVYDSEWYGASSGNLTRASSSKTLSTSSNNLTLKTDIAGNYTFTFKGSDKKLTVTYPEAYTVTYSRTPTAAADAPTTDPSITSGNYVAAGTSVTFTAKTAKTGYTFKGWYDNDKGTGTALSSNLAYKTTITANTTIYAVYTENEFEVVAIANPATYGTATPETAATMSEVEGGNITATAKNGYKFDNWTIKSGTGYFGETGTNTTSKTANTKFRPTADSEVQANFSAITYDITYNLDGGTNDADNPTNYTIETPTITLKDPTKTGYKFNGWYSEAGFTNKVTEIATGSTGNKTFYAKWTENKSTITVTTANTAQGTLKFGSTAKSWGTTASVGVSSSQSITATANKGFKFVRWELTGGATSSLTLTNATITIKGDGNGTAGTATAVFEEDLSSNYVVRGGDKFDNTWSNNNNKMTKKPGQSTVDIVYFTVNIDAPNNGNENDAYHFKIYNTNNGKWWGLHTDNCSSNWWYHRGSGEQTLTNHDTDKDNIQLRADAAGAYEIKVDYTDANNPKITVNFPSATLSLVGSFNSWNESANPFIDNSDDNTATASITLNEGEYEFKIKEESFWRTNTGTVERYSNNTNIDFSQSTSNTKLIADIPGTYTFVYNKETQKLTVQYPTLTIRLAGEFNGWNKSDDNYKFTEDPAKPGTYTLAKEFVKRERWEACGKEQAEYEFKLNISGTDYTVEGNGNQKLLQYTRQNTTKVVNDGTSYTGPYYNLLLQADITGEYLFTYDHKTRKMTVTHPEYTPEASYIVGDFSDGKEGTDAMTCNPNNSDEGHDWTEKYGKPFENGIVDCIDFNEGTWNFKIKINGIWYGADIDDITTSGVYTLDDEYADTGEKNVTLVTNGEEGCYYFEYTVNPDGTLSVLIIFPNDRRTVTFNMQGHGTQVEQQHVLYNKTAVKPYVSDVDGYLFAGWYTDAACTKEYDFNTPVTKDITLYAKWIPYGDCIFFKNNLNWDEIYVYFYSSNKYWDDSKGTGSEKEKEIDGSKAHYREFRGEMTQLGKTDIWYFDYISAAKRIDPTYWEEIKASTNIAFTAHEQYNYEFFDNTKVIRRGDFNRDMQLFIPQTDQTPTYLNKHDGISTRYYNKGLWMKYNSTESGYDWRGATSEDPNNGQWNTGYHFTADKAGGYSFTTTVNINSTNRHYFKVNNLNNTWYGHTDIMTQDNCTKWWFKEDVSDNAKIDPTITGEYVFTVFLGEGKVEISLEYPLSTGDYRLAYLDKTANSFHPGHYLKKRNANKLDTVSFFIHHDKQPQVIAQRCKSIDAQGNATWETIASILVNPAASITESGVYNFTLEQRTGQTDPRLLNETRPYTGDYYIRTDAAPGGWKSFRQAGNMMTYNSYADTHEDFDHYFCEWVSQEKGLKNVKYTVANDYSDCISDTLSNDTDQEHPKIVTNEDGDLPSQNGNLINANVRWGWDSKTNKIRRAYIAGSGHKKDRFLVLEGNESLLDVNGKRFTGNTAEGQDRYNLKDDEVVFDDMGNWIYQMDVKANKDTKIDLTALYNGKTQYFKGGDQERDEIPLIVTTAGNTNYYKMRLIYDFKINNLIIAWLPEDEVDNQELEVNMMIIRHNQEQAQQLNFKAGAQLTGIEKAYAVMTFDKYFLNNKDSKTGAALPQANEKSENERKFYWVSFPFDVKLSDVFGFGEYGDYWIMEYYDGAGRAEQGYWAETETFWKYITNKNYILKAGQGYVLYLNLNKMKFESNVFAHTSEVSLYFPSLSLPNVISGDLPTAVDVPEHTCTIERDNRNIYDSNWNLIGVPGFADISGVTIGDTHHKELNDELNADCVSFYYKYLPGTNTYSATTQTETFQTMYAYMVQFAGTINWQAKTMPAQLAARRTGSTPSQYDLRLELAQGEETDQTFVQLKEADATAEFDMNVDMTKIFNSGMNIYTLTGSNAIQVAGNAIPMGKATVPVGVRVDAAGEYTFRMPDGTDGIAVTLVDNATGTHTNMLMSEYTVTLNAGTIENRFYLVVDPDRTATSVENVGEEADKSKGVEKFLIDGKLFIRTADGIFDAKGQRL